MLNNSYQTIELNQVDDYLILTLNRPNSLNSINLLMHQELKDALKTIKKINPRAMLLSANGKGFCSGQDLTERSGDRASDLGQSLELRYNPLIKTIYQLPFPTVSAVNGVAAGAGVSLALSCDFVLASQGAKFVLAFSKIGLIPDSSATWLLPKLIGISRAKAVMMLGSHIEANEALNWGMIWQSVAQEQLSNQAIELVEKLATMPTQSLKMIKSALLQSFNNSIEEQLNLERDMQSFCGKSDDFKEGVNAFLNKRVAKFKGS